MNFLKRPAMTLAFAGLGLASFAQTSTKAPVPNGWHLMDKETSGYYGISLDKAYKLLKGKKGETVIVAVIDSGIDTLHEDLRPVLWVNPGEIPGNGKDDDGNGYIDDVHGWNFLGGRDGRNVKEDSYEGARVYHMYKDRFESVSDPSQLSKKDKELYDMWARAKEYVVGGVDINAIAQIKMIYKNLMKGDSIIRKDLGKEEYTGEDLKEYKPTEADAKGVARWILQICEANQSYGISNSDLISELEKEINKGELIDNPPRAYRAEIVQDNENDINDRFYGNNDIMAETSLHGTHVSGIIGAVRGNGKGSDGVADNVRIMTLRAVPDGDEHDKDIALAIRYAVDHGAKIINMSFGKSFSPQKHWIDDAVKYAQSKGVLLVHAAGNDAKNLDSTHNYPSGFFLDGKRPSNWITVGASGAEGTALVANFSNYGKKEVDVFAPGVNIYAPAPGGNVYRNLSGTSMAAPVTSGVAALLLSYFPNLTPEDIKSILEKSAVKPGITVKNPGTGAQVSFDELSATGGLINAYEAVKLAQKISESKGGAAVDAKASKKAKKQAKKEAKKAKKEAKKAKKAA